MTHEAHTLWRMTFPDLEPVTVTFAPAVTHGEALAAYPLAVAAEPILVPRWAPTPAELAAMFDECERAGLYGDEDRAALPAMVAADLDSTRALVRDMHSRIRSCWRCEHFRRPGLSGGYCTGRDDLAHVYGFMHALPGDGGMGCETFQVARGFG